MKKNETFNQFKKELKAIDKQIDKLKKDRWKLCYKYNKELKKQWFKIQWHKDINDMDSERQPILSEY